MRWWWLTRPITSRPHKMMRATWTNTCFTTNPPRSFPLSTCGIVKYSIIWSQIRCGIWSMLYISIREGTGTPLQYSCLKIPWTEEPGRLQSMGSLRVGHNWVTSLSLFIFMHWRRKWQPTPVFLPKESQGWGSLVGCRLWGRTESDTTEATRQQQLQYISIDLGSWRRKTDEQSFQEWLREGPCSASLSLPLGMPAFIKTSFSRKKKCFLLLSGWSLAPPPQVFSGLAPSHPPHSHHQQPFWLAWFLG